MRLAGRIEQIEDLVLTLETGPEANLRGVARELVQALMEFHGAGLERVLEILRRRGDADATMDQLAQDELVRSLLLLYGLHPVDVESRVREALDKTRPYLRSHGGNVELLSVEADGSVRLRMQGSCHGCPSSAVTLKLAGHPRGGTGGNIHCRGRRRGSRAAPARAAAACGDRAGAAE